MKTFVPCSTWRSTGSYANVFYLESFIEELARAAGKDPVEYRRALMQAREAEAFEDNSKDDWLLRAEHGGRESGLGRHAAERHGHRLCDGRPQVRGAARHRARGTGGDRIRHARQASDGRAPGHRPRSGPRDHQSRGGGAPGARR
jgi:CO/xanthine dehydrogenase Mo-binding subunit